MTGFPGFVCLFVVTVPANNNQLDFACFDIAAHGQVLYRLFGGQSVPDFSMSQLRTSGIPAPHCPVLGPDSHVNLNPTQSSYGMTCARN